MRSVLGVLHIRTSVQTRNYAYARGNPISLTDPLGLWTFNVGVNIGVQVGSASFSFSGGVVLDGTGNLGTYGVLYGGAGVGAGASIRVALGGSNAPTINDLAGPFGQVSANVGAGLDVGASGYLGDSNGQSIAGGELTFGVGVGAGTSGGGSYTVVSPFGIVPGYRKPPAACQ